MAAGLKIGEVAARSGVGVDALRFYERRGLLGRTARTDAGYRIFDESVLDQLEFIKRAQALGFSLDDIAAIVSEKSEGRSPCGAVREIVRARLAELDARLAELRRYRRELAAALSDWDASGDVDGHVCGLIEGSRVAPIQPVPLVSRRKR